MTEKDITDRPFADLPAALVEELIGKAEDTGKHLIGEFTTIRDEKAKLRAALEDKGLIKRDSDLGFPSPPTCCGTDGSYAIEKLLMTDFAAAVAVAVEGLTPPSEKRYWPEPHYRTFAKPEKHNPDTGTILRAVMLQKELVLAAEAPHDLVFLDGSLTVPVIHFNQAHAKLTESEVKGLLCANELQEHALSALQSYLMILRNPKSDKCWLAMPKYSSRRELGDQAGWPDKYDDRSILTLILEPNEYTEPISLGKEKGQKWHISTGNLRDDIRENAEEVVKEIVKEIDNVRILYYRPHAWLPALRIETSSSVSSNDHRLAILIQGIKYQCAAPGMMEPYPLYLADRMVKTLSRALPSFRQIATNRIALSYDGDIGEVYFGMHGYRTESGRK